LGRESWRGPSVFFLAREKPRAKKRIVNQTQLEERTMKQMTKKYDLDLSKMGDEELVVLAQECEFEPATVELVLRYHEPICRVIAHKASRTPLCPKDVEDAKQNAFFALREAIARYRTLEMVRPGGCRFRSYAGRVVLARFWDFVKRVRRLQNRFRLAELLGEGPGEPIQRLSGRHAFSSPEAAARHEALAALRQAVERLDKLAQVLWHQLASGKKLRQIARECGRSYDALKRQRRKLLAELSHVLRELRDS
jgi:RNA polymerase sigma factor (sigma-70 family)